MFGKQQQTCLNRTSIRRWRSLMGCSTYLKSGMVKLLLLFVFVLSSANSGAQELPEELAEIESQFSRIAKSADEYLKQADLGAFSSEALQKQLGRSPEAIGDWVAKNMSWVPYQGALKGADGTLRARRGNLLDQSIFIERLLHFAGYKTRIHEVGSSDNLKAALLDAFSQSGSSLSSAAEQATSNDQSVVGLSEQLRYSLIEELDESIGLHYEALARLLPADNNEPNDTTNALIDTEASTFYWVAYSEDGSQWQYMSPVPAVEITEDIANSSTYFDYSNLPNRVLHLVDFVLSVEVAEDGSDNITKSEVYKKALPLYAMTTPAITVNFSGDTAIDVGKMLRGESVEANDILELLALNSRWVPVFRINDEVETSSLGFDANGNLFSSDSINELAESKSAAVSGAASALGGLGGAATKKEQNTTLHNIVMDWTVHVPGKAVERYSRKLLPVIKNSDTNLVAQNLSTILQGQYSFAVQNARVNDDYINFRVANNYKDVQFILRYVFGKLKKGSDDYLDNVQKILSRRGNARAIDLLEFMSLRMLQQPNAYLHKANIIAYRDYIYAQSADENAQARERLFDIISNEIETGHNNAAELKIKAGIWDTELERALFQDADTVSNAAQHFSNNTGNEYTLIQTLTELPEADLSELEQHELSEELNQGYWIILASDSAELRTEDGHLVWWRFTPESSCMLGMGTNRFGASGQQVEYVVQLNRAIAFGNFLWDLGKCAGGASLAGGGFNAVTGGACVVCALVKAAISAAGARTGLSALEKANAKAVDTFLLKPLCAVAGAVAGAATR